MNARQPAALGVEVADRAVRAVVVDARGAPVRSVDLALADDSDEVLLDAFAHAAQLVASTGGVPTRLAWFPAEATWQRLDVSDLDDGAVARRRTEWFEQDAINATALVDVNGSSWMIAVRWDDVGARRLVRLARSVGLDEVEIEAAPSALHRVLPERAAVARRTADETGAWAMLRDTSSPVLATTLAVTARESPTAVWLGGDAKAPAIALDGGSMLAHLSGVSRDAGAGRSLDDAAMCVALGAALGALTDDGWPGMSRFEILRSDDDVARGPWTVQRLDDEGLVEPRPFWRRIVDRLRRRPGGDA